MYGIYELEDKTHYDLADFLVSTHAACQLGAPGLVVTFAQHPPRGEE